MCPCSEFGHKVVPPQPLLKALPTLFDAKQPAVRDAMKKLMVTCKYTTEANPTVCSLTPSKSRTGLD